MRNKKFIFRQIVIAVFLSLSGKLYSHVVLDYPIGNETFDEGDPVLVKWHVVVMHDQNNWDLYYSPDSGNSWEPIAIDLPVAQDSFLWTIPNITTDKALVKVIQDNNSQDYESVCNVFSILRKYTSIQNVNEKMNNILFLTYDRGIPVFNFNIDQSEWVRIEIYDLNGRLVKQPANSLLLPGEYAIELSEIEIRTVLPLIYHFQAGNKQKSGVLWLFQN
jgi:hypothetical protein